MYSCMIYAIIHFKNRKLYKKTTKRFQNVCCIKNCLLFLAHKTIFWSVLSHKNHKSFQ